MKWRLQWEVDGALKTWTPPEALDLFHPCGTSGYDKDGAPGLIRFYVNFVKTLMKLRELQ